VNLVVYGRQLVFFLLGKGVIELNKMIYVWALFDQNSITLGSTNIGSRSRFHGP
jgi:hypothetical protein